MKTKQLLLMFLICSLVFSFIIPVASATEGSELEGVIHEDGSYQFSDAEVARLNQYLNENSIARSNFISMADVISYVSPGSYSLLSQQEQDALSSKAWNSTITEQGSLARAVTYGATISKYGTSLKGYAYINRPSSEYLVTTCGICEYPGQEYYVGYAYNIEEPTGSSQYVSSCSATVIIDPPSGTYWTIGQFTFPYWEAGILHGNNLRGTSNTLSYINPYA